jgi:hypothetical protein
VIAVSQLWNAAGGAWQPRNVWSLEGGMDMLIVGLLQGALSYPFFDPVLTGECLPVNPTVCQDVGFKM